MIRRKNYFIKKGFQINFAIKFMLLLLLEAALIAWLFMHISSDTLTTGYIDSILTIKSTPKFFFLPFGLVISIVATGMAITGMVVFILLSHRIAGPLYRFEKDLEEIGEGDLTKRINLRRTDQLMELKEALNTVIDSMDKRVLRIKNGLAQIQGLLPKKDDPEVAAKLNRAIELLTREIEQFKVTSGSED